MKRFLAILLALATGLSLAACGDSAGTNETTAPTEPPHSVSSPMAYPDYTFDHTPTNEELRQMAVKAMMDYLSVQWYPTLDITYNKSGAVGGKTFIYKTETTYSGLPYTNGDKGLIHFMEYYDNKTGQLQFNGTGADFNQQFGGTCACGVMWSWATVCDSLTGPFVNYNMVFRYGCIPVGDYTYDYMINSYLNDLSTKAICEQNGKDKILAAYAQTLPADGLTSSVDNHAMMIIEKPHVEYFADGSINPNKSYLIIADQRAGGSGDGNFIEKNENGETLRFHGRTYAKYTFNQLYSLWYIPVTTVEFAGKDPYKAPEVKFDLTSYSTPEEMAMGTITTNFPICTLNIDLVDAEGNETSVIHFQTDKNSVANGLSRKLTLKNYRNQLKTAELEKKMDSGKTYTLRVEVTVSNGQTFTVAQTTVTKN